MNRKNKITLTNYKEVIPVLVEEYENHITDIESFFELGQKRILETASEHASKLTKIGILIQECNNIIEFLEIELNRIQGELWKTCLTSSPREMSSKDISMMINSNSEIVSLKTMINTVKYPKSKLEEVKSGIQDLGWMISHVTKLYAAQIEDAMFQI